MAMQTECTDFVATFKEQLASSLPQAAESPYIAGMPDRRFSTANQHAIPLLEDIVESTRYLYANPTDQSPPLLDFVHIDEERELGRREFYIGFEDHFPFGFIGLVNHKIAAEIIGPFLYREYLGRGYGGDLLDYARLHAADRGETLIFALVPATAPWALSFYARQGFDFLSGQPEFIRRWNDGLLADRYPLEGLSLVTYLPD